MIYIADKLMENIGAFSHRFRLIAERIQGGPQWLRFAMHSQTDSYMVGSELELLSLVQEGLHGTKLMLLADLNLLIDPLKLWTLPEDDLALIGTARREESVRDVLDQYGILNFAQLGKGIDFLRSFEIKDKPVFQVMNLADRLALYAIAIGGQEREASKKDLAIRKESCEFALQLCQTPKEFQALFRLYEAVCNKYSAKSRSARQKRAQLVWEDYNELCDGLVETVTLGKKYNPDDLDMEIKSALADLRQVGFSCKATAMLNLIRNTILKCEDQPQARKIVRDYMSAIFNLIAAGTVESASVGQDGVMRLTYASALIAPGGSATVEVNRLGLVTVASAVVENII
ncbi:hypothetical protein Dalk_4674 [Desulfatibacillum aliphaticivorans]|uniref:Uncharacterized protein n=1 Tax=Desulfatibacillum aliphaticivorans TaxID=218208 RepID=B8FNS1_DESAL|nr:hypothetical protein [Desulfatibacillum aliphaticivorans]ACL06352.1 hypothetical protein Dalk_4674 [Desulfatibacillum aliphaticivorans]